MGDRTAAAVVVLWYGRAGVARNTRLIIITDMVCDGIVIN